jgi:hypothetical protein
MLQSLLPGSPAREPGTAPRGVPVASARPQAPTENGTGAAPMNLNQAAEAAARYPLPPTASSTTRRRDALLPPEEIPGEAQAQRGYPSREPNFFEKLFGG